jgi:hypothetical protein
MSFSNYLENEVLDHVFRNATYSSPSAVYAALFTAAPSDTGGGTEVSGGGYERESITFGAASSGQVSNSVDVDFGTSTGAWGTVSHVGIFDSSSTGGSNNLLAWSALTASKTVESGDPVKFPSGDLTISLD